MLEDALQTQLADLDSEDRLVLRLVYVDGHAISVVARRLGLVQRPLYRRVERLQKKLRIALEARGVTRERVMDLLDSAAGLQRLEVGEIFSSRPSSSASGGTEPSQEGVNG